jgi:hypothetical protein
MDIASFAAAHQFGRIWSRNGLDSIGPQRKDYRSFVATKRSAPALNRLCPRDKM